jgi:AraC family transcriptional regulator
LILQKLPHADLSADRNTPPVFADHYLFTETIETKYEYPEHATGLGILSTYCGNGNYTVNGRRMTMDAHSFAVVNYGSRLTIRLPMTATQPAFLFFHTGLAAAVHQSMTLSHEQLLEDHQPTEIPDLSCLERVHYKTASMQECMGLLPRLGDSCSSFHSLKADGIIRAMLEQLIVYNCNAVKLSAQLDVVKRSTRIELFRRLSLTKEWMEANYPQPITLDQMANVALLNSHHFLRTFRQCYGLTPHQYLINLRLERSKQLLKESNERVSLIANAVGFESLSSFSWLFSKRFGMSPSSFRQAMQ